MRGRSTRRLRGVRFFPRALVIVSAIAFPASLLAGNSAPISFEKQIAPIIQSVCVKCHDAETAKGNLDLSGHKTEEQFTRDPRELEKLVRIRARQLESTNADTDAQDAAEARMLEARLRRWASCRGSPCCGGP